MRGSWQTGIAVSLTLLSGQPSLARDEPLVLPSSSAWVVDYADDSCALRRQFGGPDQSVVLEMRQFAPDGISYQFKVISDHFRTRAGDRPEDITLRYLPDEAGSLSGGAFTLQRSEDWRGVTFTHSLFQQQLNEYYASPSYDADGVASLIAGFDRAARARQVTGMELDRAFTEDLVLQTGSMAAPLDAMQQCLDELLEHWGIDVAAHRSLSQKATPLDMDSWARRVQQTYPLANRGAQSILRIRLDVSTEGLASGCHMQINMGEEQFERAACRTLLEHARFFPALDANGTPIASYYLLTIYYAFG